ncbi:MAG: DUF4430 domain-containing protein [Clostridia bacterium]|nr:DUF4430 domain-containing protein [Clostridia bacterium]
MRLHGVSTAEELAASYAESAGTGSEWFIFALAQSGMLEKTAFDPYSSALVRYLESNRVSAVSSKLKMALCLAASGSTDGYISYALSCVKPDSGIMAHIFALHLVTAGYPCPELDADGLVDLILGAKGEDGWSVRPTSAEVDTTAMALQALAPYVNTRQDVKRAVESALSFLSYAQLDSGVYTSYGTENPESAAQVVIALCALGLDPLTDPRFVKNGVTLLDGIGGFVSDGLVCHERGGEYSAVASSQVAHACLAISRHNDGAGSLFSLDLARPELADTSGDRYLTVTEPTDTDTDGSDGSVSGAETVTRVRVIITVAALLLVASYSVNLLARKRFSLRKILPLCIASAALVALIWTLDLKTPEDYYSDTQQKEETVGQVTVSIKVDPSLDLDLDEMILDVTSVPIADGDTVYSVLVEVCRQNRIQLENDGAAGSAYISGIDDLYEFDASPLSGWLYYVNGKTHRKSCDNYKLVDGDVIEWVYGNGTPNFES